MKIEGTLAILLTIMRQVHCKYCYHIEYGYVKYFTCTLSQVCCLNNCCENALPFYKTWYFWVSVGFIIFGAICGVLWMMKQHYKLKQQRLAERQGILCTPEGDTRTDDCVPIILPPEYSPYIPSDGAPPAYTSHSLAETDKPPSYTCIVNQITIEDTNKNIDSIL